MTTLRILQVRPATNQEWDNEWLACSYATYFHSREWAEIWTRYTNGFMQSEPQQIVFSDGQQALLPISFQRFGRGLIRQYVSSPAGTYGGWIAGHSLSRPHALLLREYMTTKYANLVWRLNPYDSHTNEMAATQGDETQALDLRSGYDALRKTWVRSNLSAIKKAENSGIRIFPAAAESEWRAYYTIYEESLRRWGQRASSRYEWSLFAEMILRKSSHIRLWLAGYQGQVIAGALCLYANQHAVYWHGAARSEFFHLRPVNYLFAEIIRDTCARDLPWFDFNPSGGHEGVVRFKEGFSPSVLHAPLFRQNSRQAEIIKKISAVIGKR